MPGTNEKTTIPISSVGADGEQPISKNFNQSIADNSGKINDEDLGLRESLKQMQRMNRARFLYEQAIMAWGV